MDGLKIPSIRQIFTFVVMFLIVSFLVRMFLPENIKQLFRV